MRFSRPTPFRLAVVWSVLALAGILALEAPAQQAAEDAAPPAFQTLPIKLRAQDVLPRKALRGPGYTVDQQVLNDGWVNTYIIQSDHGRFALQGDDALMDRIGEISATASLEEMGRSKVFVDAAAGAVTAPVKGAVSLVTSPVDTTTGAVKGLGSWVGNIGRSAVSRDPDQEGVVSATLGYAGAKRAFALEMGLDPWTGFEPAQKRLGEIARASVAGGITGSVGMGMVTPENALGLTITSLGLTNDMKEMLADNPAGALRGMNRKKLEALGVPKHTAEAFTRNYNYTPMEQSLLVASLERMKGAKNVEIYVAHATAAPEPSIAKYTVAQADMMAAYTARRGTADFVQAMAQPWLKTRRGILVGIFPTDHVGWTAEVADSIQQATDAAAAIPGLSSKQVHFEGSVSAPARQMLEAKGWSVTDRAGLSSRRKNFLAAR